MAGVSLGHVVRAGLSLLVLGVFFLQHYKTSFNTLHTGICDNLNLNMLRGLNVCSKI